MDNEEIRRAAPLEEPAPPAVPKPADDRVIVLRFADANMVRMSQAEAAALVGAGEGRIATDRDKAISGVR